MNYTATLVTTKPHQYANLRPLSQCFDQLIWEIGQKAPIAEELLESRLNFKLEIKIEIAKTLVNFYLKFFLNKFFESLIFDYLPSRSSIVSAIRSSTDLIAAQLQTPHHVSLRYRARGNNRNMSTCHGLTDDAFMKFSNFLWTQ